MIANIQDQNDRLAESYHRLADRAQQDREYMKVLQRQLELACTKLSRADLVQIENVAASAFEQPLGTSSSSLGDTLGNSSAAAASPDSRPLRGGHVDDFDLDQTTEGGEYSIVPHLNR